MTELVTFVQDGHDTLAAPDAGGEIVLVNSPTVSRKIKAVAWGGVIGAIVTALAALGIDVPDKVAEQVPQLVDAVTIVAPWLIGLIAGYFTRREKT